MSRETDQKLADMASRLKLTRMRDNMESMLRTVTDAKMTPRETLEYFLNKEIEQRESNRIKLALMGAHFPRVCTLDGFDMSAQPSLDPGVIRELSRLEWIGNRENVLFLGPPGVGKTHLARERQKFCVHGIIGARQTGASNEHEHQTQFS